MDFNTVIKRMETYMSKFEGDYPDWYVGVTKDLEDELFELHGVEENGVWISFGADSEEVANKVQKYFLDKKCDGNSKLVEDDARIVYSYKKNSRTTP